MPPWICTRCGGESVKVSDARPSLDDRFAVGWCDRCTPVPIYDPATKKSKPANRATVPLVLDSEKARDEINRRDREAAEKRLVERVTAGKTDRDEDHEAVRVIRARWASEAAARRKSA